MKYHLKRTQYQRKKKGLRWGFFILVVVALLIAVGVFLISLALPSQYRSESKLFVTWNLKSEDGSIKRKEIFKNSSYLTRVLVEMVNSRSFNKEVLETLQIDYSEADLRGGKQRIRAESVAEDRILKIETFDYSAREAQRINKEALIVVQDFNYLKSLNSKERFLNFKVIEMPTYQPDPYAPRPLVNAGLTLIGFLMIGLFLVAR